MQYKDYGKTELRTVAIHALAHMTEYKGSNKSKQWINRCFDTIYSGKDTVNQWYCRNCIEMWLEFRSRQFRSVSAQTLEATRGTLRFRRTPVEKHCSNLTRKLITESMLATKIKNKRTLCGQRVL